MDQIVEVARHSPFESIHHKVHSFFHHLYLYNNVGQSRISDGWTTHVLSFWSAWGVTTLRPLLVSSFSTGTFLVLLLSVMALIPLMQLLFQIVILLREALHDRDESPNLFLEGSCTWFVSLNIICGCHRASEYHATLFLEAFVWLTSRSPFPQTTLTHDAEKSPISHTVLTRS